MVNLRDIVLILVGASAFHTISHIWLRGAGVLPLEVHMPRMTVTMKLNDMAIAVNALVTAGLLWWLTRL